LATFILYIQIEHFIKFSIRFLRFEDYVYELIAVLD
jgi:hypothetical protein